jgi:hypothetical protein
MQKNDGIDVSVVIATLLRPTLASVIKAIRQDLPRAQIIAITHSAISTEVKAMFIEYGIQHAINPTSSIGQSWNLGLKLVDRDYFTFFSDDDYWTPNSLNHHKIKLEKSEDDFILGSVALIKNGSIKKIKPKVAIKKTFFELLQNPVLLPGTKYVSLTSFLGKRHLTQVSFEENIPFWEDIIWLIKLEKIGYKYTQDRNVRSCVNMDYARGSKRENVHSYFAISQLLNQIEPSLGKQFMKKIALRNSIAAGESEKIKELMFELKHKPNAIRLNTRETRIMSIMAVIAKLIGQVKK